MKKAKLVAGVAIAVLSMALLVGCSGGSSPSGDADSPNKATMTHGVQSVEISVQPNEYAPITVQKGVPVEWNLKVDSGNLNGCNNAIVVPDLGIEQKLQEGDNVVKFTPKESGTLPYSCWMGMIHSQINVVDKL